MSFVLSRLIAGDRAGFDEVVEQLHRLARETRAFGPQSNCARWRVVQAVLDGRFEEVRRLAAGADAVFAEKREPPPASHRLLMLLWHQGRFKELRDVCVRGAAGDSQFKLTFRCWLAVARAGLSDAGGAQADLIVLTAELPRVRRLLWLCCSGNLAEVATAVRDRERASLLYDELLPYQGEVVAGMVAHCLGSVDRHLGMLATVDGRWDDAAEHFESALRMDADLRSPPLLAHTQYWYGWLLMHRPDGDLDRAAALLTAARSTADRLDMAAVAAQATALLSP